MDTELTAVIYRTFHKGGDTIALFPFIPSDNQGYHCLSYQHIGQHGGATPDLCRSGTRPSILDEIKPLREELMRLGYRLKTLKRMPRNALAVRKAELTKTQL